MNEKEIQTEIESRVQKKLAALFTRYKTDTDSLQAILKWKPVVLMIGNYSSGKSTFINELLGQDLQRTGQAPTDDSFTIITSDGSGEGQIPGTTLVSDENLPFTFFKDFGEQFISHFRLKKVDVPFLENMAIIDSPGMLDAVTEKDRGYDYMRVLGKFAKLADLVVLMFDPHKAGTIKETYTAIRDTLPESSGEDRIVFAMSRIDECDSHGDLVRSFGTLCWNLSQMTGRKDIPRIFLTFSEEMAANPESYAEWKEERGELKKKIQSAPEFRINHILQDIDRQVNEIKLIAEAMNAVARKGRAKLGDTTKFGFGVALFVFFFLGVILKGMTGFPEETFLAALLGGTVQMRHFLVPACGVAGTLLLASLLFTKWTFPRLRKQARNSLGNLITLETDYRKHLWSKVESRVDELLKNMRISEIWFVHQTNLGKIVKFLNKDLQEFYGRIRKIK